MTFGEKLKKARINIGMKQSELAKVLKTTNTTISNWENNVSRPDVDTVAYICGALQVKASYFFEAKIPDGEVSIPEYDHIKKYRALDSYGKEIIDLILDKEYERTEASRKQPPGQETPNITHLITYYQKTASAGTGELLFDDMYESKIPLLSTKEVEQADFAVGVNGNSMKPLYNDGDILLVKAQDVVEIGEIGIFIVNNESFVKKAGEDKLISINPEYDDIIIHDSDNLRCVGKVIGKVEAG